MPENACSPDPAVSVQPNQSVQPVDVTMLDKTEAKDWNAKYPNATGDFRNPTQMVDQALNQANGQPIGTMQVIDHGGPGYQEMGDWAQSVSLKDMQDPKTKQEYLDQMSRLNGHFAEDGQLQLRGCHTGEGEAGTEYLKEMSTATGVPTSGAHELQYPSLPGTDPSVGPYQGAFTTCQPNTPANQPCAVTDPRRQMSYSTDDVAGINRDKGVCEPNEVTNPTSM
jgi:hypothetical protein